MTQEEAKAPVRKTRVAVSVLPFLLLVAVAAALIVTRGRAEEEPTTEIQGIPVRSFAVEGAESGREQSLRASGTLSPIRESTLAFAVSGVVHILATDQGDHVSAQSTLASLDPTPFRAALDQSEAQLVFLESRSSRSEQLAASGAIAKEEFDADVSERQGATARVTLSRWNLDRSVVRAPFAGSIKARFVEAGEVVTAGTPAFHLIATDSLKLEVSVPARDLARIGASAVVSSPDFPGLEFPGRIDHRPVSADPRSSSVPVVLHLENPGRSLLPGTIAQVRFVLSSSNRKTSNAARVEVPLSAVRTTDEGPIVFRVINDRARAIPVQLGEVRGDQVSVQAGVSAGDKLVLEAPDRLRDGDLLTVVQED